MKKIVSLILLSVLLLCGCDTKPAEASAKQDSVTTIAAPVEITPAPTSDPTPESTPKPKVELVELNEKSVITKEGDYKLSGVYSGILSDESREAGWYYYYSEGTENGVPWKKWVVAPDMYTTCKFFCTLENLGTDQSEPFHSRFRGFVLYNLNLNTVPECADATEYLATLRAMASDSGAEIYEFTLLQENPEQLDSDGYPALSLTAVPLKPNQSARQDFLSDVPEHFLRSWENEQGTEPMWAVVSYDEATVYLLNLREYMHDIAEGS